MAIRRPKLRGREPGGRDVAARLRDRDGPAADADAQRLRLVRGEVYADWESVYRDNVSLVFRVMFSRVGNRMDAEDLTTEVFLAALGPLRTTATVPEVRAYLLATARTVLAAHWRRVLGHEVTTLAADHLDELAVREPSGQMSDAPQRARAILDALPERYRRILELRFLEARSVKEAAAELGVSVTNAKVLQHRALRHAARGTAPAAGQEGEGDEL
ncbi:RNA polymerase sigma factor [Streptomyces sp. NBC_00212]|uniref:RNA polymerase sigma factor n=1 Tax=Streptomyces sp. NBC_00212 TaxID=2975684 RepID=UPI0032466A02